MEQDLSAARRMEAFKRKREEVFAATKNTKRVERTSAVVSRERSAAATRQVPVELLAREWLCERGLEERRYLVESVLPSLVVALERLLTDVTSRGLEGSVERHNDFNPINTLAQHLMRSNPSHNAEGDGGHAYCQALEEVADELRKFGRAGDEAKLVALRKGVKERREMREREEAARSMEVQRRRAALEDELARWRLPTEEELATVEVQQAVRSWLDTVQDQDLSQQLQDSFAKLLSAEDSLMLVGDLIQMLLECSVELTAGVFSAFTAGLARCAGGRRLAAGRQRRRALFTAVFSECDPDKAGRVDRFKMLELFASYYDSLPVEQKTHFHDPHTWPTAETLEAELWAEELVVPLTSLSEEDFEAFLDGSQASKPPSPPPVPEAQSPTPQVEPAVSPEKTPSQSADASTEPPATEVIVSPPTPQPETRLASSTEKKAALLTRLHGISAMSTRPVSPSGPGSSWDHALLCCQQFVRLVELFVGAAASEGAVESLAVHLREGYSETALERTNRLEQGQLMSQLPTRHCSVSALFSLWDSEHSGWVELDELALVLSKWSGSISELVKERVAEAGKIVGAERKSLNPGQFHSYLAHLTAGMKQPAFEELAAYLRACIKPCSEGEAEARREGRRRLLSQLLLDGKTSGLQLNTVLQTVVNTIENERAAAGRQCSVAVALLEAGGQTLSYQAASAHCREGLVGCQLHRSAVGVSFQAVDAERPVHVPNVQQHGSVALLCPQNHTEQLNGSLVVAPIVTPHQEVVGTVSVDTLSSSETDVGFVPHEISFYQGVGVCVGEVVHWVQTRLRLRQVCRSALAWLQGSLQVDQTDLYFTEPDQEGAEGYALRKVLSLTASEPQECSSLVHRSDNIFREYLFTCVDSSIAVSSELCGRHRLAWPLRDHTGCAVAVLDLCLPSPLLDPEQSSQLWRMAKVLTLCFANLSSVADPIAQHSRDSSADMERYRMVVDRGNESVLFEQLLLADLSVAIARLDKRLFAELRSCAQPSTAALPLLQTLLCILYPDRQLETAWEHCRKHITAGLVLMVTLYNPAVEEPHAKLPLIKQQLGGVSASSVQECGSLVLHYLYSWVCVCVSLLEHFTASQPPTPPATKDD